MEKLRHTRVELGSLKGRGEKKEGRGGFAEVAGGMPGSGTGGSMRAPPPRLSHNAVIHVRAPGTCFEIPAFLREREMGR